MHRKISMTRLLVSAGVWALVLILAACAQASDNGAYLASLSSSSSDTTGQDTVSPTEPLFCPALDSAQTELMSNVMNQSCFAYDENGTLYGKASYNGQSALVRSPEDTQKSELLMLCRPYNLIWQDGELYFLDYRGTARADYGDLYVMRGGDFFRLAQNVYRFCISDGVIYYVDADSFFVYSCGLDGGQVSPVLERAAFYTYVVGEWLLYQDDADGETLHAYHIPSGTNLRLTTERSFNPIIVGSTMWYVSVSEGRICSLGLTDGVRTVHDKLRATQPFYVTSTHIYFYEQNVSLEQTDDLPICIPLGDTDISNAIRLSADSLTRISHASGGLCIVTDCADTEQTVRQFRIIQNAADTAVFYDAA